MSYTIKKASEGQDGQNPAEEAKMRAAFGPNWRNNIDEIKDTAKKMREQTLRIHDANPETYDKEAVKKGKVCVMSS
jgi:hypothetical protein